MPSIKLIPSTYYLSSSSYLSVANADSMYADTGSDSYATVTNSRASTTSYYIYLRGFNFDAIPDAAVVTGFTVRLKARESGVSTSTSYKPYLANGTTAINGSCDPITTTAQVLEFDGLSAGWDTIKGYGSDFGIRINCRRASRNTTGYVYIYGAEIEVTYTVPDPRTITSTLTGSGTISPSGSVTAYDGDEYELEIRPADPADQVTVTRDGADVTGQLVAHGAGADASFTADAYTTHSISSGSSYAGYAVGHTAESPSSSGSGSNMYASSGSTGYAEYTFDFSGIPAGAVIEGISARVYGHRESSTIDSSHVSSVQLYNGSTAISEDVDFPSTSDSMIEVEATDVPASLANVTLRHFVGYYGGLVRGITLTVTYSTGSGVDHYTYTFTVAGSTVIAVTIGSASVMTFHRKAGGAWAALTVTKVYKKVNGSWVQLDDWTQAFDTNGNYAEG